MKRFVRIALGICLGAAVLMSVVPRPSEAQVLSGIVGGVTGTAAGGYITLSIVVVRAQLGDYLHDFHDLFGWPSTPIVVGAAAGTALGVWRPERLWTSLVFGSVGTALGAGIGYGLGASISERPEGKWAGAAIGAGAGMTLGTIAAIIWPQERFIPKELRNAAVVPISITLRVP